MLTEAAPNRDSVNPKPYLFALCCVERRRALDDARALHELKVRGTLAGPPTSSGRRGAHSAEQGITSPSVKRRCGGEFHARRATSASGSGWRRRSAVRFRRSRARRGPPCACRRSHLRPCAMPPSAPASPTTIFDDDTPPMTRRRCAPERRRPSGGAGLNTGVLARRQRCCCGRRRSWKAVLGDECGGRGQQGESISAWEGG